MFCTDEEVQHRDGRLGVVERVFARSRYNQRVLVRWPAGNATLERAGALAHHIPVVDAEVTKLD
jgi:hypothetical protein